MGQEESTDPKDTQLCSLIVMMPSTGIPEQSPITGLVGTRPPVAEVSLTQVSSSSSREDYSGDDIDWDNVHPAPDISKFSHLAIKDMEITLWKVNSGSIVPSFVLCIDVFLMFPF